MGQDKNFTEKTLFPNFLYESLQRKVYCIMRLCYLFLRSHQALQGCYVRRRRKWRFFPTSGLNSVTFSLKWMFLHYGIQRKNRTKKLLLFKDNMILSKSSLLKETHIYYLKVSFFNF